MALQRPTFYRMAAADFVQTKDLGARGEARLAAINSGTLRKPPTPDADGGQLADPAFDEIPPGGTGGRRNSMKNAIPDPLRSPESRQLVQRVISVIWTRGRIPRSRGPSSGHARYFGGNPIGRMDAVSEGRECGILSSTSRLSEADSSMQIVEKIHWRDDYEFSGGTPLVMTGPECRAGVGPCRRWLHACAISQPAGWHAGAGEDLLRTRFTC